jgi:hypothetical protein
MVLCLSTDYSVLQLTRQLLFLIFFITLKLLASQMTVSTDYNHMAILHHLKKHFCHGCL